MEIIKFEKNQCLEDLFKPALEKRSLIPIIGSGFTKGEKSLNGVVPDGEDFKNIMIDKICMHSDEISKEDFIQDGYKFSEIADEFFKRVPKEEYKQLLRSAFTKVNIHSAKKRFLKINWPYIYTLNIDDGIERNSDYQAIRPYKKLSKTIVDFECVFKMHGDVHEELSYEDMPNIIFSKEQYISSLESNSQILNFFQSDYGSKNCMFIGCSLDDELDLKYAIATTKHTGASISNRIYITTNVPKGLRKSRLESFGINKVILIDDYDEFYTYLYSIYDNNRFSQAKPFDSYKNPDINIYDSNLEKNKEYLIDIVGVKSSEKSLPFYAQEREVCYEITEGIQNEVVSIVSGKRFSGKTTIAKHLVKLCNDKAVYFFNSGISFNHTEIEDLSKLKKSILIFDTNSLDNKNILDIDKSLSKFHENEIRLVIFANESDNLFHSAATRLTNDNYYRIDNRLTTKVVTKVNQKLSQIGLINSDKDKTILDNCYRYFEAYEETLPIQIEKITDKELALLIILATDYKTYSVILNILGISRDELNCFVNKMSPFIEVQDIGALEAHQHSGFKIVSNSSSWLFKILGEYRIQTGSEKAAEIIYEIVSKLRGKANFEGTYKKIISFDNLNQSFYRKGGGSANLIFNVYEKLENILYEDGHFWLQRAKSILHLKRHNIDYLNTAIYYAKKSHHDTLNSKLQINTTTTLAMLYGRIANLESYSKKDTVVNAIDWYYAAFQENQYNKRYIAGILGKSSKRDNDVSKLCSFILSKNSNLSGKARGNAEFVVNKVRESGAYNN